MPPPTHMVQTTYFGAAAFAFDERMANHARAGHAVRVADGDSAAVDVEQFIQECQAYRGSKLPAQRTLH